MHKIVDYWFVNFLQNDIIFHRLLWMTACRVTGPRLHNIFILFDRPCVRSDDHKGRKSYFFMTERPEQLLLPDQSLLLSFIMCMMSSGSQLAVSWKRHKKIIKGATEAACMIPAHLKVVLPTFIIGALCAYSGQLHRREGTLTDDTEQ